MKESMAARLTMLLPRLAVLVVIWLLAAASFTFAASSKQPASQAQTSSNPAKERPKVLVVPDVRRQAYVFAKGILQDAGFAWRVDGAVKGYAANTVAVQNPAPGSRVVDNGAPTVVVRLQRNPEYPENGLPENRSPFAGTTVVLLRNWRAAQQQPKPAPAPAKPKPSAPKPPTAKKESQQFRKPDFVVPGAKREPAKEMPLPERARKLAGRLAAAPRPTPRLVRYWLYQHSWIVTGARFGWKDGDDALRLLIRIDRDLQARFGFGARSAAVASRALADVSRQKG
jgi:hypothetical protein